MTREPYPLLGHFAPYGFEAPAGAAHGLVGRGVL